MTDWKDKLGKTDVFDVISPADFPEAPIVGHSAPWTMQQAGNGHVYVYDAQGTALFHVYCWDEKEWREFCRKLELINKAPK